MRTYEAELRAPLRNALGGELVRALLIQVQKLKVDTASAMLGEPLDWVDDSAGGGQAAGGPRYSGAASLRINEPSIY